MSVKLTHIKLMKSNLNALSKRVSKIEFESAIGIRLTLQLKRDKDYIWTEKY
jgi:hypothetical protein